MTCKVENFNYTIVYGDHLRKSESLCSYKKSYFTFRSYYSLSKNKVLPNSKSGLTLHTVVSITYIEKEVQKKVASDGKQSTE